MEVFKCERLLRFARNDGQPWEIASLARNDGQLVVLAMTVNPGRLLRFARNDVESIVLAMNLACIGCNDGEFCDSGGTVVV